MHYRLDLVSLIYTKSTIFPHLTGSCAREYENEQNLFSQRPAYAKKRKKYRKQKEVGRGGGGGERERETERETITVEVIEIKKRNRKHENESRKQRTKRRNKRTNITPPLKHKHVPSLPPPVRPLSYASCRCCRQHSRRPAASKRHRTCP